MKIENKLHTIRYDLIGSLKEGITKHPQRNIEGLGMIIHKYQGEPIGDCIFMLVSNLPAKLPGYIELSNYTFYKV